MEEEINIKDLMIAVWRKKIVIIIVTLIFFAIGVFFYGKNIDSNDKKSVVTSKKDNLNKTYMQTAFMFGRGTNEEFDGVKKTYKLTIDAGVITNLNAFVKSKNFLEDVLTEIDSNEKPEKLQKNINIWGNGNSDIITLLVSAEKEDAIKITNIILEYLKEKIYELYEINELIVIDGPVEIEEKNIEKIENEINGKTAILEENLSNVPQEQNGSKKKIVLITLMGFILTTGIIVVIEIFSSSVKSEEGLEKATNTKVLVKIPKTNLDVTDKFELLRVKLSNCKTILVTSPEKLDGKSFVSMNLSKAFARNGKKVLLTNALCLINDENFEVDSNESKIKNLTIVLDKSNNDNEVIEIEDSKIEKKLKDLENLYDVIIIDSENVLDSANTLIISKFVKSIILVSSERKTKLLNIVKAKNSMEDIGGIVIGNILNKTFK